LSSYFYRLAGIAVARGLLSYDTASELSPGAVGVIDAAATICAADDDDVRPQVGGYDESGVFADTVRIVIELVRESRRGDFLFFTGSAGIEDPEALWLRLRHRLGLK
jgi:hypothetical protein